MMQRMQFTPQVQAAMQAAAQVDSQKMETEQEKLSIEFELEREAEARKMAKEKEEHAAKVAEKKRLAKIAEKKRLAKIAEEKRAAELAEMRAAEEAARKEAELAKREAAEHEKRMAEAAARGRQRALEKMQQKEAEKKAEAKAYEEERKEREALEELRLQKLMREKREEIMAKSVMVTNDGEKKENVMVTPSAPLITVSGEAGMTHSYPQRTFKPEEPKTTDTVTLKASGETSGAVDHIMFACLGLAVMGSVAFATRVGKSWMRSPMKAPEAGVELLTKSGGYVDLEDQDPIAPGLEASWASSAVDRALAAAEGK